ncbi:hypothetical protein SISSUDRAFT_1046207 [Sistotremastrum suecicum HHB10207 ss-3]|uniref:N-acetyltransferase domain-containing protein n=1 Tax=Sistotremastrum suecicum HHB10207 ss-3 TaxID=1314776 RepID=A0A166DY36_9AGAM|nr:hypothetical protein SISSUDRAFT_1046207 [Sistotremastrum suecicum HHB10207 ss-3]
MGSKNNSDTPDALSRVAADGIERMSYRQIFTVYNSYVKAFRDDRMDQYMAGHDGTEPFSKDSWFQRVFFMICMCYWVARPLALTMGDGRSFVVANWATSDPRDKPHSLIEWTADVLSWILQWLWGYFGPSEICKRYEEFGSKKTEIGKKCFGEREAEMMTVNFLVVDPHLQGSGRGKRLLNAVHNIADDEGRACWLISSGEHNISFYVKHGYRVVGAFELAENNPKWKGPKLMCPVMVREPKATQDADSKH